MKTLICSVLRLSRFVPIVTVTVVSFSCPALAVTGFTGVFDTGNFTLTNDNADGSVNINDATTGTVVLTGGDNNLFAPGTTTWKTTNPITSGQLISFAWSFAGESNPDNDTGGYIFGYLDNETSHLLGNQDGNQGNISQLLVKAGQVFGFFVKTENNTGGPGRLTITEFNFDPAPVPLETDAVPVVASLLFFGLGVWLKQRNGEK